MHSVHLKMDDSVYPNIMFLLKNLNIKGLVIEEKDAIQTFDDTEQCIDFSQYNVLSFKDIKDPVKWQQDIRNEWN